MSSVAIGWVRIGGNVGGDYLEFHSRLGPLPPKVTGGYGGWTVRNRPRRRGFTVWEGVEPLRVEVDVMIDNVDDNTTVQPAIKKLEKLAGLGGSEPPRVQWAANAPHDIDENPNMIWVIEDLDWGDSIGNQYGNPIRQPVLIKFLQYVESEYTDLRSGASKHRANKKPHRILHKRKRHVIARKGETLIGIAARELGDSRQWKSIGDANGIRDPRNVTVGQKIYLP